MRGTSIVRIVNDQADHLLERVLASVNVLDEAAEMSENARLLCDRL